MFSKKKLLNILHIALLLSMGIIASSAQLFFEEPGIENLTVATVFLLLWGMAVALSYILKNKAVLFFTFWYMAIATVFFIATLILSAMGEDWNPVYFIFWMLLSPTWGFSYFIEYGVVLTFALTVISSAVSLLLYLRLINREDREADKEE